MSGPIGEGVDYPSDWNDPNSPWWRRRFSHGWITGTADTDALDGEAYQQDAEDKLNG